MQPPPSLSDNVSHGDSRYSTHSTNRKDNNGRGHGSGRTRLLGTVLLLAVIAGAIKIAIDFNGRYDLRQKQSLIQSLVPGGQWLCRRAQDADKDQSFTLSINPGVQVASPNGPINGAAQLDSTTHSPASSDQIYFGSSDFRGDKIQLKWLAHWTHPEELRPLALKTQHMLSQDPARYTTDLSEQNYVSNLFRGITVFEKPIMEETITVNTISDGKFSGTTVASGEDKEPATSQPIDCIRSAERGASVKTTSVTEKTAANTSPKVAPNAHPKTGSNAPHNGPANPPQKLAANAPRNAPASQPQKTIATPPTNTPPPTNKTEVATTSPSPPSHRDTQTTEIGDQEARSFVDQWFRTASSATRPEHVLPLYAPQVQYYDRGLVSKGYVKQDKQYYFNRWPVRESRIAGPVNVADAAPDRKIVSFRLWYHLESGNGETRQGTTPVRLVLGKRDGKIYIVGEG